MLTPIPVGDDVAAIVKAAAPAAGTPITDAILQTMWENIIARVFNISGGVSGATIIVAGVTGVTSGGSTSGPSTTVTIS